MVETAQMRLLLDQDRFVILLFDDVAQRHSISYLLQVVTIKNQDVATPLSGFANF